MEGVSMEEFGPVSLDYFNQRRVLDVVAGSGKKNAPVWTILFEGDGELHNFDPTIKQPTAIKGAALTMVVFGKRNNQHVTEARFGLEVVYLNPTEYAIVDPNYTGGKMVYAQRSRVNMPPPPEPTERIASGPVVEDEDADD